MRDDVRSSEPGTNRDLWILGTSLVLFVGLIASDFAGMEPLSWGFVAGMWVVAIVSLTDYKRYHA